MWCMTVTTLRCCVVMDKKPPKGKDATWDYLEKRGLNEKPGETPLEKFDRSAKK